MTWQEQKAKKWAAQDTPVITEQDKRIAELEAQLAELRTLLAAAPVAPAEQTEVSK